MPHSAGGSTGAAADMFLESSETDHTVDPNVICYNSLNGVSCAPQAQQNRTAPARCRNWRKVKIMATLVNGNFWLCACYALMAPFFPREAEMKGVHSTEYGLVFGVYQLFVFISAPVYGRLLPVLKPGFMLKTGTFVAGLCAILFGLLDKSPGDGTFLALSLVIRSVEALGACAFFIASYTLLTVEFSDNIGAAMAVSETSFSLGIAAGPVIGGALYQVGGYILPFIIIGSVLIVFSGIATAVFSTIDEEPVKKSPSNVRKLFCDLGFFVDFLSITMCFLLIGFNEATLETHLRQFSLNSVVVGAIFMVYGATDVLTAIAWGFICNYVSNTYTLLAVACVVSTACFLIIGPSPFMPFPTTLWIVILSQALLGLGMSGSMVCGSYHAMKNAVERGFPDNEATYGMVSGLLLSAFSLGSFVGPSLGGYLLDSIGYEAASTVVAALEGAMTMFVLFCGLRTYLQSRQDSECKQLEHTVPTQAAL